MNNQNTNDTNIYYQDGTVDTQFTDRDGVTHIISYDRQSDIVLNMRTIDKEQMIKSKPDIRQESEKPINKMVLPGGGFRSPVGINRLEREFIEKGYLENNNKTSVLWDTNI